MTGYHVTRLRAAGPVTAHYDGPCETDGPFLIVWPVEGKAKNGTPALIVPSHALIDVEPCDGSCLTGATRRVAAAGRDDTSTGPGGDG